MNNIACRLFKEQVELIKALPVEEAKTVLYQAVTESLNQFEIQFDNQNENQNGNQIENQNENAYVSVSDSVSLSVLSKSILDLLKKNIVWKEFSNNYGGKRDGAGKQKKEKNVENKNNKLLSFGEFGYVLLTQEFYNTLVSKYNQQMVDRAVSKLDSWLAVDKQAVKRGQNHQSYFKSNGWVWVNNDIKQNSGVVYQAIDPEPRRLD